jgi:hypothetical protein
MDDMERRRHSWNELYRLDGRTRFVLVADYNKGAPAAPKLWYELKRERVDWAYAAWQAAMEETRHVPDDPEAGVREIVGAVRHRVGAMPKHGRSPVDGQAADDQAEEEGHVPPVRQPNQRMVLDDDRPHRVRARRRSGLHGC